MRNIEYFTLKMRNNNLGHRSLFNSKYPCIRQEQENFCNKTRKSWTILLPWSV